MTNEQATREWVAHMVSVILENFDQGYYERCRATVIESIKEDHGTGDAREFYEQALRDRGVHGYERRDYARAAGDRLADEVAEIVAEEIPTDSLSYRLLMDLLDTGDRVQWALIANSFMPELSDLDDIDWE